MRIEITKNGKTVKVSKSAFNNFFKNNGWVECESSTQPIVKKEVNVEVEDTTENDDLLDEAWEEAENEDENEDFEKPLSEMNRNELTALANKMGIDVTGISKNAQLREAIKAAM